MSKRNRLRWSRRYKFVEISESSKIESLAEWEASADTHEQA